LLFLGSFLILPFIKTIKSGRCELNFMVIMTWMTWRAWMILIWTNILLTISRAPVPALPPKPGYVTVSWLCCRWFERGLNVHTGKEDWLFTGDYWSRDWTRCPDIFWPLPHLDDLLCCILNDVIAVIWTDWNNCVYQLKSVCNFAITGVCF